MVRLRASYHDPGSDYRKRESRGSRSKANLAKNDAIKEGFESLIPNGPAFFLREAFPDPFL